MNWKKNLCVCMSVILLNGSCIVNSFAYEGKLEAEMENYSSVQLFQIEKNIDRKFDVFLNKIPLESIDVNITNEEIETFKDLQFAIETHNNREAEDVYLKIKDLYQTYAESWSKITPSEKRMIFHNPLRALGAYICAKEATKDTIIYFGKSRVGDRSDAFRHALWNGLMTVMLDKDYAQRYANAHEDHTYEYLRQPSQDSDKRWDGYRLLHHHLMDLHNNRVGRNLTDKTSIGGLANLLYLYIKDGGRELYWLYDYYDQKKL